MSTHKLPREARIPGIDYSLLNNDYLRRRGLATRPENASGSRKTIKFDGPGYIPVLNLITVDSKKDDVARVVSNIKHLLSSSTDEKEALTLYFSILCLQLKNWKSKIVESLESWYDVKETPWNTSIWAKELGGEGPTQLKKPELLVVLGQLLFIPFMRNTPGSYVQYMSRKTNDLCALIKDVRKNEIGLPTVAQTASRLRCILNIHCFKIAIIDLIVDSEYASVAAAGMGTVLSYIGEQLRWTDMVTFVMIREELIRPVSPLLRVNQLIPEWENFNQAILMAAEYKYPEYFSIVADVQDLDVMYTRNFPTLAAVARLSARTKTNTSAQIDSGHANQLAPEYVERYFRMHRGIEAAPRNREIAVLAKRLPRLVAKLAPNGILDAEALYGREKPATATSVLHENRCKRPRRT